MKTRILYFLFFIYCFLNNTVTAQLAPAQVRCIAVNGNTNTITWTIPPDPTNVFTSYEVFNASVLTGPYSSVAVINNINLNFFIHSPALGSTQSQYYYVIVKSNGGTQITLPTDTLRSVFLNLINSAGVAYLNWNATRSPLLPSASTTYTLSRQHPVTGWAVIYTGSKLNYNDTIYNCNVFFNYKVETSDALPCTSFSNIKGGIFQNLQLPNSPHLDSVTVNPNGSVTIGWQPSNSIDVSTYTIYQYNAPLYTPIGTVNSGITVFTYNAASANTGTETYCIAAADSCGVSCVPTPTQTTIFLSSAFDLCSRSVKLTWTSYLGLPLGILKYDVYCAINAGTPTIINSTSGTTYLHSNLNPGDTYCYYIKVRNTPNVISANSNISCQLIKAPTGPAYVYIKSVSVNTTSKVIELSYTIDNSRAYKGATIFKSEDGITFTNLTYQAYSTNTFQMFVDADVKTLEKNYYYKIQISDSCGNAGVFSNVSKSIVLKVSNNTENIFYNTLSWDNYSTWLGNVDSYNIYRAVNGVYNPIPIANVGFAEFTYVDDVQEFVKEQGKFSYYIEAVEGPGNIYGFTDKAKSNPNDAYVEVSVFVPNAFAPRGLNNVWLPNAQYVEKTDYKVMVFNRWGSIVFQTQNDTEGWSGNNTTDDVFAYLIEYKNARGEYVQLKGHLTLLR